MESQRAKSNYHPPSRNPTMEKPTSADKNESVSPKRKAPDVFAATPAARNVKKPRKSPAITPEAELTYERVVIKDHFKKNAASQPFTSATTKQQMGPKVISAAQVGSDLTNSWKQCATTHVDMTIQTIEKGNAGDGNAALSVGRWYQSGERGFAINHELALAWYRKAAEAGSIEGMVRYGAHLIVLKKGFTIDSLVYLARAAEAGSDFACIMLAVGYKDGRWGLLKTPTQAKGLLQRVVDGECAYKHASPEVIARARAVLGELN